MHKSINVEKVIWFTHGSNAIGIVIINNSRTKERSAYIGVGGGSSIKQDIQDIADHGITFPVEAADLL